MAYYLAPFTFRFETSVIEVDGGITDVDCGLLYAATRLAQASEEGILFSRVGQASGLNALGPGVQVGITVELLGAWQLRFTAGNYIARVAGGNLIGGPSGDPIAYTAGVQVLLIQSAASTVVTTGGAVATPAQVAAAVLAAAQAAPIHSDVRRVDGASITGTVVLQSDIDAIAASVRQSLDGPEPLSVSVDTISDVTVTRTGIPAAKKATSRFRRVRA